MDPMLKGVLKSAFGVAFKVGKLAVDVTVATAQAAKESFDEVMSSEQGQKLVDDINESLGIIRDDIYAITYRNDEPIEYTEYTIEAAKQKRDDSNDKFKFNF